MAQQRKVKTIPATLTRFTSAPITEQKKRRVAGYARVSTDHDDQFTSYEAQIDYYTKYIKSRDDWKFVQVYTDEGITGTSTKRREGFRTMVADALDGKIDLIVTKSVSRFARNTVDSLTTIRQLKEKGIEVYFEKENIWTFDGKGELRSISRRKTSGHSTARASCCSRSCRRWHRKKAGAFPRTAHGDNVSDSLMARSQYPSTGSLATTEALTAIWSSTRSRPLPSGASTSFSFRG